MRRLTRKLVGVAFMTFAMLTAATTVMAKDGVWSGNGSIEKPYLIEDEADLKLLSQNLADTISDYDGMYFTLTNDIDITTTPWVPIGSNSNKFRGIFDGNNKCVSNVNVNLTRYSGFFAYNDGTIKNLTVKGTGGGRYYIGLVAGYNIGTIENVSAIGTVEGTSYNGVITGYNKGVVRNATASGSVTGKQGFIGGITGYNNGGTMENCYNESSVTGSGRIGGIAGGNVTSATIKNCYNSGTVATGENVDSFDNTHNSIGGIVGYNYNIANVYDCTNTGSVSSTVDSTGGVIGYGYNSIIQGCNNTGNVSTTGDNCAAILAEGSICKVRSCYYAKGTAEAGMNGENDNYEAYEAILADSVGVDQHTNGLATGFYVAAETDGNPVSLKWIVVSPKEMKTEVHEYQAEEYDEAESGAKFGLIVNNLTSDDSVALCSVSKVS